jgi:hypothetical protein
VSDAVVVVDAAVVGVGLELSVVADGADVVAGVGLELSVVAVGANVVAGVGLELAVIVATLELSVVIVGSSPPLAAHW